jgi:2-C-methyl-D-erythritol 4-phosphate cytidylyltransferase
MKDINVGIILSAGTGSRFKSNIPKQYVELNGKEIISYSINAFNQSKLTDFFFLVVGEKEYESGEVENKYGIKCIKGGGSRNQSLFNALKYIGKKIPNCKNILIHEAARPLITSNIIDQYFNELEEYDAVVTTAYITDSLGKLGANFVDRSEYYLIQAPEAFNFKLLFNHFSADSTITATVQQLPANIHIKNNYGFNPNFKITYPEDLFILDQFMKFNSN